MFRSSPVLTVVGCDVQWPDVSVSVGYLVFVRLPGGPDHGRRESFLGPYWTMEAIQETTPPLGALTLAPSR